MTLDDYYWYSKAILGSTTLITALGVYLRWDAETKNRRPLAYMSIGLLLCCIIDFVLSVFYEYHPLMLKSGCSFGTLFFALIIVVYSYSYLIAMFTPTKHGVASILRLNAIIIVFVLLYALLVILGYENLPNYELVELFDHSLDNPFAILWILMAIAVSVSAILVNVMSLKMIFIHVRNIKNYFSQVSEFKYYMSFATYIIYTILLITGFVFIFNKIDVFWELMCMILVSILLVMICVFSHFQKDLYSPREPMEDLEGNCSDIPETAFMREADQLLLEQLKFVMEDKELYRLSEMTTELLAHHLQISRKKLYLFLKKYYGTSFSDYINSYRLAYAESLMKDKDSLELSTEEIAKLSGFSSQKTFNKLFKENYSVTPNVFRSNIDFKN